MNISILFCAQKWLLTNVYFLIGIGSFHERTGDVLAYLYVWSTAFLIKPASITVISLTFSQYFLSGIMRGKCVPIKRRLSISINFQIVDHLKSWSNY